MLISAIIVVKNEEDTIEDCLRSIRQLVNEIIIVDDESTDKTVDIARKYTSKIFRHHLESLGLQLKYALTKTTNNWVIWLDADERITPELEREIREKLKHPKYNGYHVFFHVLFLGKDIQPQGKETQGCIRLFNKKKSILLTPPIHPRLEIEGEAGVLKARILHLSYRTISQTLEKFNKYSSWEAEELFAGGGRTNLEYLLFAPLNAFFHQYILWGSYRYGFYGLMVSTCRAIYYLMKHLKLWELNLKNEDQDK